MAGGPLAALGPVPDGAAARRASLPLPHAAPALPAAWFSAGY